MPDVINCTPEVWPMPHPAQIEFVIWPHRSLSDETVADVVMAGGAIAAIGTIVIGVLAGPLAGALVFASAAGLLAALALHQQDRRSSESITITPAGVRIERRDRWGRIRERLELPAYGLAIGRGEPLGAGRRLIVFRRGDLRTEVGWALGANELDSLWAALSAALGQARHAGGTIDPKADGVPPSHFSPERKDQ